MALDQLIMGTFTQCFKKYFYDELVIGKLAHSEFKDGVQKGDEVDVIMPGTVSIFDYAGGDLPEAEKLNNSVAKVRIDKGKAFHFELDEVQRKQIENAPDIKQKVNLVKEYSTDATKQFASAVDGAYANLHSRAGHKCDNGGSPIALDADLSKEILAYMQAKFQRGDGKGHTNWIDGQMIAIVPPEYQFYLGKLDDFKYVESGHKKMAKGFIGQLSGWDILVSNNVAQTTKSGKVIHNILFGIKGKTLAGGVSSDLNTKSYEPEKNFNTRYKGYGLFGVGAPRVDFLGTATVEAPLKLTSKA